jgi:hypothetical protein
VHILLAYVADVAGGCAGGCAVPGECVHVADSGCADTRGMCVDCNSP